MQNHFLCHEWNAASLFWLKSAGFKRSRVLARVSPVNKTLLKKHLQRETYFSLNYHFFLFSDEVDHSSTRTYFKERRLWSHLLRFFPSPGNKGIGCSIDKQDKTWAAFSNLKVVVCVQCTLLGSEAIRPNLKLKTRPKQLLGYRAPRLRILADIFTWLIDLSLVE